MTIKFYKDRIEFDEYVLRATPTGFSFNGEIQAKDFVNGFQGSISGYSAGGRIPVTPPTPAYVDTVDVFPFSTDANATDVRDLTVVNGYAAGHNSTENGYTSCGFQQLIPGGVTYRSNIDKFSFASSAATTNIGSMTQGRYNCAGNSSRISGYCTGGTVSGSSSTVIDRFPFVSDGAGTSVGSLTAATMNHSAQSSAVDGYVSGGWPLFSPGQYNKIEKFPFAANQNSTDLADLTANTLYSAGQSSTTHGYASGGSAGNKIDKFSFATGSNATNIGSLTVNRSTTAGQSSITHGYNSGGSPDPPSNVIDKFPFATDASATDVGDLAQSRYAAAGIQH